jgi:hypothetical protein
LECVGVFTQRINSSVYGTPAAKQVPGAIRHWRCPFRCRGSRRELAVAQLSTLGKTRTL